MRIKPLFHLALAASLLISPASGFTQGLAGAYLAANQANATNDYAAAAEFYTKALKQDPNDAYILQNALLSLVALGETNNAIDMAKQLTTLKFGSQLSDLVLLVSDVKNQKYDAALNILAESNDRLSPLLRGLLKGWVLVASGDMSAAVKHFDSLKKPDALRLFAQYHKALAVAMAGDFELANKIIEGDGENILHVNRGSIIAHAEILSQLGKFDQAAKIIINYAAGTSDRQLLDLLDKMEAKQAVPFNYITSAQDGVSETFLTLASVLSGEKDARFSLVYARLAEYTRPNNIQALLLLSDMLKSQQQYDLATQVLAKVPVAHPMYLNAELSRADILIEAGKPQAAIAILQRVAASHPDVARVHMVLGDTYSGVKQYRDANKEYTAAIDLFEKKNTAQWALYYARGVSYERLGEWKNAEADLRKALKLSPEQPSTLNYLGYSLVEKGINLKEALGMIERAVRARPNDAYITDSLGWVLYRIGKFKEAVAPMERAAELMPADPVINDHLGDVYWKVNRHLEARFQWSRAMSFGPEEKDATRIRRKLDVGLDAVLTSEKASTANAN